MRATMRLALVIALLPGAAVQATFHFMQIEQVIGGVNGDVAAQAIQLRMRNNSQHLTDRGRLVAYDAAGANPIVVCDLDAEVEQDDLGARVLIATSRMTSYTEPVLVVDFLMTSAIPASYLVAGSLTFENDDGTLIVWRLSWGGSGYTGSGSGALTNDTDGDFSPAYDGSLPSGSLQALLFDGPADAKSSNNAADYGLTAEAAVLTNNVGTAYTVTGLQCPNSATGDSDGDLVCDDVDNCPEVSNADQADSDNNGVGDACQVSSGGGGTGTGGGTGDGADPPDETPPDDGGGDNDGDGSGGGTTDNGGGESTGDPDNGDPGGGGSSDPSQNGDGGDGATGGSGSGSGSMCGVGMIPVLFGVLVVLLMTPRRRAQRYHR